jgi:molybdenum cofactor cytidylyltransferase
MMLSEGLRVNKSSSIALVGAGGKTTAVFLLAEELQPSIITTTTHLGEWQVKASYKHYILEESATMPELDSSVGSGISLYTGKLEGKRFGGLNGEQLKLLKKQSTAYNLPILIEADGARQKPLKAPAEHEPVIPDVVDTVIVIAGLSGLGKPLSEEYVHRPDLFSQISGILPNDPITHDAVSRVLVNPLGGLKNIPPATRRIALLNQADTPELQAQGRKIAESIIGAYESVGIASLRIESSAIHTVGSIYAAIEKTAGLILAAGGSTRYGKSKPLLLYHGVPFVRKIAETALASGLDPVIAVTGAQGEEVAAALENLPVTIIQNSEWEAGQSSSIQAGLNALYKSVGGAIFLLADQPHVTISLVRSLIERHAQDLPSVVAPFIGERRANPVLFDRRTFAELRKLKGDEGGRAIFSIYPPTYLEWADEKLLLDVDTPEDYRRLLELENDV